MPNSVEGMVSDEIHVALEAFDVEERLLLCWLAFALGTEAVSGTSSKNTGHFVNVSLECVIYIA